MSAPSPAGVVLTGGASSRMGTDKALIDVDGVPMVVWVVDALRAAGCRPVQCQGGDLDALAELGLDGFADDAPGAGPVVAIRQAVRRLDGPVVVAACDLADLDAASVDAVVEAGSAAGAAVAVSEGRRHLLSYWSRSAAVAAGAALEAGVDAYGEVLERVGAVDVPVAAAPMRNVNHPGDLA